MNRSMMDDMKWIMNDRWYEMNYEWQMIWNELWMTDDMKWFMNDRWYEMNYEWQMIWNELWMTNRLNQSSKELVQYRDRMIGMKKRRIFRFLWNWGEKRIGL